MALSDSPRQSGIGPNLRPKQTWRPPRPKRTLTISVSDVRYQARGRNFAVGDVVIDAFAGQKLAGLD